MVNKLFQKDHQS